MKQRSVRICATLIVASIFGATSAQADTPRLFDSPLSWILKPVPIGADGSPSRAMLGDFLFQQPLRPDREAVLARGQSGILPGIAGKRTPVSLDGQRFLAVTGGIGTTPYCSLASITNKGQRLCFVDSNNDGRFDHQIRAFGLGDPFERMLPGNITPGAIAYSVTPSPLDPMMLVGLVVRKRGSKGYTLEFAVSEKGRPVILDLFDQQPKLRLRSVDVHDRKFTADQLPVNVDLYGATVEIVAISGKDVTYRLLSGFDPAQPIVISRAGTMPIGR